VREALTAERRSTALPRPGLVSQEPLDLGGELVAGRDALLTDHPLEPLDVGARVFVGSDGLVEALALGRGLVGERGYVPYSSRPRKLC